jgi:hypothetical protein
MRYRGTDNFVIKERINSFKPLDLWDISLVPDQVIGNKKIEDQLRSYATCRRCVGIDLVDRGYALGILLVVLAFRTRNLGRGRAALA